MTLLPIVKKAMRLFPGSFINANNELILIPKFNVYLCLDDVETEDDFKVKLCEWFSRDCCCALRYAYRKRLEAYWANNLRRFNELCGTDLSASDMRLIYSRLGNSVHRPLAKQFVEIGFDVTLLGY